MLTYDLTKRGNAPLYVYLYQCIKSDILNGKLSNGERLPSKRALAQHLNIGIITVAGAYDQLLMEGYIISRERSGYFVQNLSEYEWRDTEKTEIAEEFPEEEQEQEAFADFKANSIGQRNFPISVWNQLMRRTLSQKNEDLYQTVPFNGLGILRNAIADYLRRTRGMNVSPGQIIIGAGTEYLYSRLMQMFGPACTFAIEDPGYKKFAAISANHGNPWKYIPIDDSGLVIDELEESGADVVHVSPANHFPTGIVMPMPRRIELFQWANRARKRYIIEDDYDSEFRYTGNFIPTLFAEDTQNKIIYLNTFSKSMVPSLRISYMVLPPKLMKRYSESMSFYSCTVSSFEQYALALFISEGHLERHLSHLRHYYRDQRARILDAIAHSPLARISKVIERNAGTHFLLQVQTSLTEAEVKQRALEQSLRLSVYSDYSYSETVQDCTLVINYAGIDHGKMQQVMERLSAIFPECSDTAEEQLMKDPEGVN